MIFLPYYKYERKFINIQNLLVSITAVPFSHFSITVAVQASTASIKTFLCKKYQSHRLLTVDRKDERNK